jgi:hypothetical protein
MGSPWQRFYGTGSMVGLGRHPGLVQIALMQGVPRAHKAQRPFGERTLEDGRVGDHDPSLLLAVDGVVVGKVVIVPVDVEVQQPQRDRTLRRTCDGNRGAAGVSGVPLPTSSPVSLPRRK